jgi:hypothetical protein
MAPAFFIWIIKKKGGGAWRRREWTVSYILISEEKKSPIRFKSFITGCKLQYNLI